jgi:hypothetical protein
MQPLKNIFPFSKEWFEVWQWLILFFINFPIKKIRKYFRTRLSVDVPADTRVNRLFPNSFRIKTGKNKYQQSFYGRNIFTDALHREFILLWKSFHSWDMLFANRFKPAWNLGFDTLQFIPDAGSGSTTVDGNTVTVGDTADWSTIRNANGTGDTVATTSTTSLILIRYNESNNYSRLERYHATFDTSSLPDDAAISNTAISIVISQNFGDADLHVASTNPASDNDLVPADHQTVGRTSFGSLSNASIILNSYNNINFNSTGIAAVSKTGISKFSIQSNYDINNTTPNDPSPDSEHNIQWYSADDTSLSPVRKPKLTVTYTVPQHYTLETSAGSFSLTGNAAGLTAQRKMSVDAASFALTGQDVNFAFGYGFHAEPGSYALTGNDVAFKKDSKISAETGEFLLTGNDINLNFGYGFQAEAGNFILTGNAVTLKKDSKISVSAGAFNLTGNSAGLYKHVILSASPGSFTYTGYPVYFYRSHFTESSSIFGNQAPMFEKNGVRVPLLYAIFNLDEPENLQRRHQSVLTGHRSYRDKGRHWIYEVTLNLYKYQDTELIQAKFEELWSYRKAVVDKFWKHKDYEAQQDQYGSFIEYKLDQIIPIYLSTPTYPDQVIVRFKSVNFFDNFGYGDDYGNYPYGELL